MKMSQKLMYDVIPELVQYMDILYFWKLMYIYYTQYVVKPRMGASYHILYNEVFKNQMQIFTINITVSRRKQNVLFVNCIRKP